MKKRLRAHVFENTSKAYLNCLYCKVIIWENETEHLRYYQDDCLRVQQLIDQEIAVTVFKSLNGDAPNYLKQMFMPLSEVHTHNTRNHSTGLSPFHTNTSSGQKSFAFARSP